MGYIKFIEKGTTVFVYNIKDSGEDFDTIYIVVGEDILISDHNYEKCLNKLVIDEEVVDNAISNYMIARYSDSVSYVYHLEE